MTNTYKLYQTFDGSNIRRDAMFYRKDSKFYNLEQAEQAFSSENRNQNYNLVGVMKAESLDHAFELSNKGYSPKGAYSMSVGDILVNEKTGKVFIVSPISFDELYKKETANI